MNKYLTIMEVFSLKKIIGLVVGLIVVIILFGVVFKPVIYYESKVYYRVNTVDDYIFYEVRNFTCSEAEEIIYEDNDNIYYLSCISNQFYLIVKDDEQFRIKEGLEDNLITIEIVEELMSGRLNIESKLE